MACLTIIWDRNYSNQNVATMVDFTSLLLIEKENENILLMHLCNMKDKIISFLIFLPYLLQAICYLH